MQTSDHSPLPEPVSRFIESRFPGARVERLAGDASDRTYYRVLPGTGASHVLALHRQAFDTENLPFLETTRLFRSIGLPVPRVVEADGPAGIILMTDLGDRLLQSALLGAPGELTRPAVGAGPGDGAHLWPVPTPEETDRIYREAVELIVCLQTDGTPRLDESLHAGREALDAERLRFELEFFAEHAIRRLAGAPLSTEAMRQVALASDVLCAVLEREPRVLCHRDFHSRNLLLMEDGHLGIVDHQDARRGPDTYDLASLLLDPYVPTSEQRSEAMLGHYLTLRGSSESLDSLQSRFDRMAVQRLLKAAGSFAFQKTQHGNAAYLPYLAPALARARGALERCEELAPLLGALQPLFDQFPPAVAE